MHSDLLLRSSCDQLCYLSLTFWTYYYLRQLCCLCYRSPWVTMVTTKPGQSKYTAGLWRDRSVLKTKLLTGERKWAFPCAMFRARDINGRIPLRPANQQLRIIPWINFKSDTVCRGTIYTGNQTHSFNCKQRKFR